MPGQEVRFIRDVMIPMPDGVRLAGDLWLPAPEGRYPVLLTFLPYTKDLISPWQQGGFHGFARHGYAEILVDFRGTGNSEGINQYFTDPLEREDGYHIVEWLAAQPWCTGDVGVWGISYGGITAMSIATTRPPHLKAIIPISGSFDVFDYHICPHGTQGLLIADMQLGAHMAARNLLPPIIADAQGNWQKKWHDRLDYNTPWIVSWRAQPPGPDVWQARQLPLEQIAVPTFSISGWRDIYVGPMIELYERVGGPKKMLMGPWKHIVPPEAFDLMLRWWDHWIKHIDNGIMDEPPVTICVQGSFDWRNEPQWPIAREQQSVLYLDAEHGLRAMAPLGDDRRGEFDEYEYNPCVGTAYLPYHELLPHLGSMEDQSADDRLSLIYTGAPLETDLEITGTPLARIFISATVGEINLVAKLCAVDDAGCSIVITEGRVSSARGSSYAPFSPLGVDEIREVHVPMRPTAYRLKAGERVRLSLAGSDFPETWPTPEPYQVRVYHSPQFASRCELPVVPAASASLARPNLPAYSPVPSLEGAEKHRNLVHHELSTQTVSYETEFALTTQVDATTAVDYHHHAIASVERTKPWLANCRASTTYNIRRPVSSVKTVVQTLVTQNELRVEAEVLLDGHHYRSREWNRPTLNASSWKQPPSPVESQSGE